MAEPNCAPTREYFAIPLGSSSAAPVTNPGPKILSVFRNQLTGFGEVATTVTPANCPVLGPAPIRSPGTASENSFPFGGKIITLFALQEPIRANYLIVTRNN